MQCPRDLAQYFAGSSHAGLSHRLGRLLATYQRNRGPKHVRLASQQVLCHLCRLMQPILTKNPATTNQQIENKSTDLTCSLYIAACCLFTSTSCIFFSFSSCFCRLISSCFRFFSSMKCWCFISLSRFAMSSLSRFSASFRILKHHQS